MLVAANGCRAGILSIGDVVAVNALLIQLARPMDFIGYTFSEIRQSLVDMEVSLRVLATPTSAEVPSYTLKTYDSPLVGGGGGGAAAAATKAAAAAATAEGGVSGPTRGVASSTAPQVGRRCSSA
jgi:ABC-type multidrug transport system fused ATPase/permease subunit